MEVTNRFKGLDLIVPEELWTEVHDIVQEAVIKTIPKKKKCKKAKWLSEAALQVAEKRREARGKGEKPRDLCPLICLILGNGPARHLPAHLPATCERSGATPACSSA